MPRLNENLQRQIQDARQQGMSVKDIASKFGLNRSTISKYTKVPLVAHEGSTEAVEIPMVNLDDRAKEFGVGQEPVAERVVSSVDKTKALDGFFRSLKADLDGERAVPAPVARVPAGDTQALVQMILLNAEAFPDLFPNPPTQTHLANKSYAELAGILKSMEHSRAVKSLSTQFKQVFFVCSRATEVLGKATLKLRTDGMTDALMQQQAELDYLFRELAIKHADKFSGASSPEVRLITMFGITMLQTDATNRLRERMTATAPAEVQNKYADT